MISLLGAEAKLFRTSAVFLGVAGVSIIVEALLTVLFDPNKENAVAIAAGIVLMVAIAFYLAATSTILVAFTSLFGWVPLSQSQVLLLIVCGTWGNAKPSDVTRGRYSYSSRIHHYLSRTPAWN